MIVCLALVSVTGLVSHTDLHMLGFHTCTYKLGEHDSLLVFPIATTTGGMVVNILRMVKKNPGNSVLTTVNKFGKIAGKLMLLALLISMLWVVRITVATSQKDIVKIFNEDSQRSRTHVAYHSLILTPRFVPEIINQSIFALFLKMGGLHDSCKSNGRVDVQWRSGQ
jgi:hypothetical protein